MWKELLQAAIELVFPPRQQCPLCAGHSRDSAICEACRELLAGYQREEICPVCGSYAYAGDGDGTGSEAGPSGIPGGIPCYDCRSGARPFDLARSVAPYEGPVREAVHRLKYRRLRELARPLGELMARAALREPAFSRTGAIVPVPLHPRREQQRGFNQALLLARQLEDPLQAPVLERALVKIRETPPQTGLPRRERLQNLVDAFVLTDPGAVSGKIITVIDDVFTTGSTTSIISQVLRQGGATGVLVLTLAGPRQTERI